MRRSIMLKKSIVVWLLAILALILAACGGQATTALPEAQLPATATQERPAAPPPTPVRGAPERSDDQREGAPPSAPHTFDTQTSDAGRVVVDVTPLTLNGDTWDFDVALNTHSVNLGVDMTEVSVLRCDQGSEHAPVAWDGAGPGGHHRSGTLTFAALDHPTSFVEIVIRDVAGEPERLFHWEMPGDDSAAGNSADRVTPATDDGPARLVLSSPEFHFGDVVMSQGVVVRTIDITNTGPGTLRIEGVEPT
jgi:hypothetical protein